MAVRDAPRFMGDGLYTVAHECFVDLYSKSDYPVYKSVCLDSAGVEQEVHLSPNALEYKELVAGWDEVRVCKSAGTYPCCGPVKSTRDPVKVSELLYRMRQEEKPLECNLTSAAMATLLKARGGREVLMDAKAIGWVLTVAIGPPARVQKKLTSVSQVAFVGSVTHSIANGESWASLSERLAGDTQCDVTHVDLESRCFFLKALLQLCENASIPDDINTNVVETVFAQGSNYVGHLASRLEYTLSQVVAEMLIAAEFECDEPDTDLFNDIDALDYSGAINMAAINGRPISHQIVYLAAHCKELAEKYEDEENDEAMSGMLAWMKGIRDKLLGTVEKSRNLCGYHFASIGNAVAHSRGLIFAAPDKTIVLSRMDIQHALEVNKEAMSQYLALKMEREHSTASEFVRYWLQYHRTLAGLGCADAAMAACAQRDLDLVVKNSAIGDVFTQGVELITECDKVLANYGVAANPIRSCDNFWRNAEPSLMYERVRSFRLIVATWYSPVYVANQCFLVYHLGARATVDGLQNFRVALRQLLASSHYSRTGRFPQQISDALDAGPSEAYELAYSSGNVSAALASGWTDVGDGAMLWDKTAVKVRDKANIVPMYSEFKCAQDARRLGDTQKREILFFQDRDPVSAADKYRHDLMNRSVGDSPVVIVYKPEQKFGSRVVAQEDCYRRKCNSVIQNNCMNVINPSPGSLMASSAAKLQKIEHENTLMLATNNEQSQDYVCMMLGIDFTKFGHYIAYDLQDTMSAEMDKYFGTEHIQLHMAQLKQQDIITHPAGFFQKFKNIEGADGQGLRNGMWQLMLGAMAIIVFRELRNSGNDIRNELRIMLSWFMDDHNFPIRVTLPKGISKKDYVAILRFVRRVSGRIRLVIEETYTTFGVLAEASKATTSISGYGQTGDVYDAQGVVRTAGKGLQTALTRPMHVAPSLDDLVTVPMSAFSGAMANGCCIKAAYTHMMWACAYQVWESGCRVDSSMTTQLGFMLACPTCLDGIGVPPLTTAVVDRGLFKSDDALFAIMGLANSDSPLKRFACDVLSRPRAKFSLPRWSANPLFAPPAGACDRRNTVDTLLANSAFAESNFDLRALRGQRLEAMQEVVRKYTVFPTTATSGMWRNNPASVAEAEVAAIANSATAKALLPAGEVRHARFGNLVRAQKYARALKLLGSTGMVGDAVHHVTALETLGFLGYKDSPVLNSHPHRHLLTDVVGACEYGGDTSPGAMKLVARSANQGSRSLTAKSKGSTTTELGSVWFDGNLAAMTASVDVSYACRQVGALDGVFDITSSLWENADLRGFVIHERNAFVELSAVAIVPPTHCPALKPYANRHTLDYGQLDPIVRNLPDGCHVNHYQLEVAAFLKIATDIVQPKGFHLMRRGVWHNPAVIFREEPAMKPLGKHQRFHPKTKETVDRAKAAMAVAAQSKRPAVARDTGLINQLYDLTRAISMATSDVEAADLDTSMGGITVWALEDLTASLRTIPVKKGCKDHNLFVVRAALSVLAEMVYHNAAVRDNEIACHIASALNDTQQARDLRGQPWQTPWYQMLIPTTAMLSMISHSLSEVGADHRAIRYLGGIAEQSSFGRAAQSETSFTSLFLRATQYGIRWWLSLVGEHIHAIRFLKFDKSSSHRIMEFNASWAAKYLMEYRAAAVRVDAIKTSEGWRGVAALEGEDANLVTALYKHSLMYGVATHVHRTLANILANRETDFSAEYARAAVQYLSRCYVKYTLKWKAADKLEDMIRKLRASGRVEQSERYSAAIEMIRIRHHWFSTDAQGGISVDLWDLNVPRPSSKVMAATSFAGYSSIVPPTVAARMRLAAQYNFQALWRPPKEKVLRQTIPLAHYYRWRPPKSKQGAGPVEAQSVTSEGSDLTGFGSVADSDASVDLYDDIGADYEAAASAYDALGHQYHTLDTLNEADEEGIGDSIESELGMWVKPKNVSSGTSFGPVGGLVFGIEQMTRSQSARSSNKYASLVEDEDAPALHGYEAPENAYVRTMTTGELAAHNRETAAAKKRDDEHRRQAMLLDDLERRGTVDSLVTRRAAARHLQDAIASAAAIEARPEYTMPAPPPTLQVVDESVFDNGDY